MNTDLIDDMNKALEVDLPARISDQELKVRLTAHINHLINHDFEKLVSVLYRIDVSEEKLKTVLKENPDEDAGKIIADLIIERQLQKINSRKETKSNNNIPDDEKW
jgi:protein involved in sex pheromone biosynthesis